MTTTGIIFICILIAIPSVLFFLFAALDESPFIGFFMGGIMSMFIWLFSAIISYANADLQYGDPVPTHNLIVENQEYQYVIHVKNDSGIVEQSIIINRVKDYELVRSDKFTIFATYKVDMYGMRTDHGYLIAEKK